MINTPRVALSGLIVAILCASAPQAAWAQCSDPLARMWDNVKGPTNTNDQPGRIDVRFTACGDTGGPTRLGVRAWVYGSNGRERRTTRPGGPGPGTTAQNG